MSEAKIPAVQFSDVYRHFGDVHAVDGVTLEIPDGQFFTMLGPSGSGKTTCLRLIAGFEQPSAGAVFLHGQDVSRLPPYERDVNTVFQDYALFPHMSVGENIAYGLMIRKLGKPEIRRQVEEMLELVQLSGLADRRPGQLSGGQRQRVALARALVNHPRVLLLDEPLGALDLKLRQQMQFELKSLQQRVGITFVYVTHDQEEALSMSDRIAVFNQGKIEQVGTPSELYEQPVTPFVAGFVGVSNLVSGEMAVRVAGSPAMFSVRPEKIQITDQAAPIAADMYFADGVIRDVTYLGLYTRYLVDLEGDCERCSLVVVDQNREQTSMDVTNRRSQPVRLLWHKSHNRYVQESALSAAGTQDLEKGSGA